MSKGQIFCSIPKNKKLKLDLPDSLISVCRIPKILNVRVSSIFECNVILSILNKVVKFSNAVFFRQIILQSLPRQNLGMYVTDIRNRTACFDLCSF